MLEKGLLQYDYYITLSLLQVFVELEELRTDADGLEWEETARWIKFEEDVEEGSGRWGRPHISALAFHSLADLRRGLERGVCMSDLLATQFPNHCVNIGITSYDVIGVKSRQ